MQKVVLISSDNKTSTQLRAWFRNFSQPPYLENYSSVVEFEAKYSEPIKKRDALIHEVDTDINVEVDEETRQKEILVEAETSPIRLLMIDLDAIASRPLDWIIETRRKLFDLGHITEVTEGSRARIMILGYDDPHLKPDRFRHELIDDMLIKPLDQQLCLQKIELLLAEKPNITPSFLFRAQAEGVVEIGKDAVIDEISDFAISVRNPTPLADGVFAQIHSRVFGEGFAGGRVIGRVYASIRHPQYENLWMVRFTLFGITSAQLAELRKFLRTRAIPGRLRPPATAAKLKTKLPPRYRIAVIDLNRDVNALVQSTIEENFDRTAVTTFTSYTRFLAALIKVSEAATSNDVLAESTVAVEADSEQSINSFAVMGGAPPNGRMDLVLDEKHTLIKIGPTPLAATLMLGIKGEDLLAMGNRWIDVIPKTDHDDFQEFLTYTASSGRAVTAVRMIDASGNFLYAEVKGQVEVRNIESAEERGVSRDIKLEFRPIEQKAWMEMNRLVSRGQTPDSFRFDAIIIDGGLIRGECEEWTASLHQALVKAKAIDVSEPIPRVIVVGDETAKRPPSHFVHRGISDYIFKPLDRKLLTDKVAACLPQLTRSMPLDGSLFLPCELTAQICKSVEMVELSEYGLTVRHPTPFRPRVFMKFFTTLFGEGSDGVIGRCIQSLPGRGQNDQIYFLCHFIFFGASDELHKRIRNWIREDYVNRKDVV